MVKQPGIKLDSMERKHRIMNIRDRLIIREVEISIKYEGFIKREESQLRLLQNMDRIKIPPDIDFKTIPSLSREIVEKLNKLRPATLSQALSLSGITPAAVIAVFNFLNSRKRC